MAGNELRRPLTPARLRALLLESEPRIFLFDCCQTESERAAMMSLVPENAQTVARQIMVTHILEYLDYLSGPEFADKGLLYFMATDDDEDVNEDNCEFRQHSSDWQLILLEDEHGFLCDFNGWPGDNQSGAGIYYENETGRVALVFANGDSSLAADIDDPGDVIADYEERRGKFNPGEDADV